MERLSPQESQVETYIENYSEFYEEILSPEDKKEAEALERYPWQQLPDEPDHWFEKFEQYRLMGEGRSLGKWYHDMRAAKGMSTKTNHRWGTPMYYIQASRDYRWKERAEAWDEHLKVLREQEAVRILSQGLALQHERIKKLEKLAEKIESILLDERNKRPSPYLVEQYRGTLDDIAKEVGGRRKEVAFTGPKGGPIQIETSWGRGGAASEAWQQAQIAAPSPIEATVVEEIPVSEQHGEG